MGSFLFYRLNDYSLGRVSIPESFKPLVAVHRNWKLLCSLPNEQIYHIKNERIELFLIGNFTFLKGFHVNLESIIKEDKIGHNELNKIFRKLNGIYCCIIWDKFLNQFNLITDFLGFYPVYLYQNGNEFVISSELKYFHSFDNIPKKFNQEAIQSYLHNGHLILDQTWFQNIRRTRPASIYNIALQEGIMHREYYWTWATIQKTNLPKKELIEKYNALFTKGIADIDFPANSRIAISLSGGLDSRWIAQIAKTYHKLESFTFSTAYNYEARLAEKTARVLNIPHTNAMIDRDSFLRNRLKALLRTDGHLHLGHLHEAQLGSSIHSSYTHCFHGFYGGGIYADTKELNKRITDEIAYRHFSFSGTNPNTDDSFYNITSIDPYLVDQKIRFQSSYSIYQLSSFCKMIIPYYNMDWLEFNYSIDDKLQLNNKFYLEVLKQYMHADLLRIPWQKTGLLPKFISLNVNSLKFKIPSIMEYLFQKLKSSRHFINYNYYNTQIDYLEREIKQDLLDREIKYQASTREEKLRMISLALTLNNLE